MTNSYDVNAEANATSNSNFQGIIDAFNVIRANAGEDQRFYPPNFQGVIRAVLDLQDWGNAHNGEYPPGWEIVTDDDGNVIGGNWNPPPDNGTLWFDTRQGRLFTWQDDGFYQTNGGDGLPYVGTNPPQEEIQGHLWYNTDNQSLYLWDGNSWVVVSTDAIDTASLALSNPTRQGFTSNRPFLPDSNGLLTQQDLNIWTHQALLNLEDEVNGIDPVVPLYMGETPPNTANEGDFWYDTANIQLLVSYSDQWVPTSIPLTAQNDFIALSGEVSALQAQTISDKSSLLSQINVVAQLPRYSYTLYTDKNQNVQQPANPGLYLQEASGLRNGIRFTDKGGIEVKTYDGWIEFDTTALQNEIASVRLDCATKTTTDALYSVDTGLQAQINELKSVEHPTLLQVNGLEAAVGALPTTSSLSNKLDAFGAKLTGQMDANYNRIQNLGNPVNNNDVAHKAYVDAVRNYSDSTFATKVNSKFSNLQIEKYEATTAAIDFSGSTFYSSPAFKYQTNGSADTVTFGTTDNPFEYAWQFAGNEEFSYIHGTSKVAAINKDGVNAKAFILGDIATAGANGSVITNKIDVGERLATYKTALTGIRTALNSATSFEEFKTQVLPALSGI